MSDVNFPFEPAPNKYNKMESFDVISADKLEELIFYCKENKDLASLVEVGLYMLERLMNRIENICLRLIGSYDFSFEDIRSQPLSRRMAAINDLFFNRFQYNLIEMNYIELVNDVEFEYSQSQENKIEMVRVEALFEGYYDLKNKMQGSLADLEESLRYLGGSPENSNDLSTYHVITLLEQKQDLQKSLKESFDPRILARLLQVEQTLANMKNNENKNKIFIKDKVITHPIYKKMLKNAWNYFYLAGALVLFLLGIITIIEGLMFTKLFPDFSWFYVIFFLGGGGFLFIYTQLSDFSTKKIKLHE